MGQEASKMNPMHHCGMQSAVMDRDNWQLALFSFVEAFTYVAPVVPAQVGELIVSPMDYLIKMQPQM